MVVLPPGTLLQLIYLRERLAHLKPGRFVEIGPGSGEITQLLLDLGWSGESFDLDAETIGNLQQRNIKAIQQKRFKAICADFLTAPLPSDEQRADLVISCMVMEHMDEASESAYMRSAKGWLSERGLMIGLVPSSPAHWGIEDDIAGHCRRYTRASLQLLAEHNGWELDHVAGLTYPLSNILLPLSNYLVSRAEHSKLSLSPLERTKQSGKRKVHFKTHFPSAAGLVLNRVTMYPLHLLQKLFSASKSALILYFEAHSQTK